MIVTIRCRKSWSPVAHESELLLNSRPVSRADLGRALKTELSRPGHQVVYVRGEDCLTVEKVVQVIDTVRDVWYEGRVVLMTPQLEKNFDLNQR